MQWWVWLVIWAFLAVALVGMLVLFAVWLFFKLRAIALELEHLASRAELLDQADRRLTDQRRELAVLADIAQLRRQRTRLRFEAMIRQQARRRASIQRAKELVRADPAQLE